VVVGVVVELVFRCTGFAGLPPLFRPDVGALTGGDVVVCGGSLVGRVGSRPADPPHSVVLSRALASECLMSSSQLVSATLPIRKAAVAVPSTRCQRAGLRRIRSMKPGSALLLLARRWRAT
jgi:hypothetical protein